MGRPYCEESAEEEDHVSGEWRQPVLIFTPILRGLARQIDEARTEEPIDGPLEPFAGLPVAERVKPGDVPLVPVAVEVSTGLLCGGPRDELVRGGPHSRGRGGCQEFSLGFVALALQVSEEPAAEFVQEKLPY